MAQPAFLPTQNDRSIAAQLHDEIKRFIGEFKQTPFRTEEIAVRVLALSRLSKEAEKSPHSILHDAGQIVQNIVSQPLLIPGIEKDISLLKAAEQFEKDATSPHLPKTLEAFQKYAESTRILLQELELLSRDLIF